MHICIYIGKRNFFYLLNINNTYFCIYRTLSTKSNKSRYVFSYYILLSIGIIYNSITRNSSTRQKILNL